ncbi:MAG: transcriptional regulator [Paenibacillus sp.]|jgi:AraC-like DNA-binding protein|nr:transcriptional regulator [Paenibacillus sp.]
MDYEFLTGFTPRIMDIVEREKQYWHHFNYVLLRERTRLHTLSYVYAGKGMLELGGDKSPLVPGTIFQIRPNEHMLITTQADNPVCFYSFHFLYRLIRWEGGEMTVKDCTDKLPFPSLESFQEEPALEEAFRAAFRMWSDKNSGYEWLVKLQFLSAVQLINELTLLRQEEPSTLAAVQKAIHYMKAGYREMLSRDTVARHVSLSPGYFSVTFKKHTGISPIQYLTKIRIDSAKHLLKSSKLPIKQIAEESGFADSFYFSRQFVKETGMTPRDYRNS